MHSLSVGVGRAPRLRAVTSRLVDLQPAQTLERKNQFVSATLTAAGWKEGRKKKGVV